MQVRISKAFDLIVCCMISITGCCHVTCCQLCLRQGDVGNSGEHGNLKLKLYYTCVEGETSVRERSRNAEDDQSPDIVQ